MQPMLNIAIRAARSAGDLIIRKINKLPQLHVETKSPNDYVSEVDRQAEALIIDELLKAYPNHGIVAEESGQIEGSEDYNGSSIPLTVQRIIYTGSRNTLFLSPANMGHEWSMQ